MGADGHVVLVDVGKFAERFPDIDPKRLGLHQSTVLGVKAYVYYWDTEAFDPPWCDGPPSNYDSSTGMWLSIEPYSEAEREAIKTLASGGFGEDITVWT